MPSDPSLTKKNIHMISQRINQDYKEYLNSKVKQTYDDFFSQFNCYVQTSYTNQNYMRYPFQSTNESNKDLPVFKESQISFIHNLSFLSKMVYKYDSPLAQEKVFEVIDFDKIYDKVYKRIQQQNSKRKSKENFQNEFLNYDYEDFLVMELLSWFKNDFFAWVNIPHCENNECLNDDESKIVFVKNDSIQEPNHCSLFKNLLFNFKKFAQDGEAIKTEVYKCTNCSSIIKFPRYNDPVKLLQTRRGRCGEWANCFMLILRSMNINARYIWNQEDHVWTEYYSNSLKDWIHLDPCENSYNQPDLYSKNWGKKMSYVFGISNENVRDLSSKYIVDRSKQLPRDLIDEEILKNTIVFLNAVLKKRLNDKNKTYQACIRDNIEFYRLTRKKLINFDEYNTQSEPSSEPKSNQAGRISGSSAWKKERGEGGV
ncbi:peptide-N4-(N-acetyl-beta-glucosaminyl)asparagine amidase ASCRUDRAFT_5477 [Ascoidea rubescens DSM 1968]|uniref:Peptide:N-glycanase 1 n=1 Tax=Ascoidea rubescens DSM 1968 TaxID=1344418 RepID=A0A1D2VPG4_9ASCO|nr:hypothetical protein ASCRUDRAFT_5477 [Ascoidea rubescens DSM 1968]ODV63500.1 hypothetical protein ASCRUDRAFT_5477 [Ascoidea rubescens DSM 1968]